MYAPLPLRQKRSLQMMCVLLLQTRCYKTGRLHCIQRRILSPLWSVQSGMASPVPVPAAGRSHHRTGCERKLHPGLHYPDCISMQTHCFRSDAGRESLQSSGPAHYSHTHSRVSEFPEPPSQARFQVYSPRSSSPRSPRQWLCAA